MASFRYYRLSNFVLTNTSAQSRFYTVNFVNTEGLTNRTVSKAFGTGIIDGSLAKNAFDGNNSTEVVFSTDGNITTNTLGYEFPSPVTVTHIFILTDASSSFISLSVEASNDGVNWVYYGQIVPAMPMGATGNKNYKVMLSDGVVRAIKSKTYLSLVKGRVKKQKNIYSKEAITYADPYGLYKESLKYYFLEKGNLGLGYILGRVYETINRVKIPVSRKVYLQDQRTGATLGYTWSDNNGVYMFKRLSLEVDFMIISVDHNKQFGVEGMAFKKPKEVVINNDGTLSYPSSE